MNNKMTNFGELKSKLLTKLTESYTSKNKGEIKDLVKKLQSNKSLVEMYVFYEDMENMTISNKDKAKLFVESLEPQLIDRMKSLKKEIKDFGKSFKDVIAEENSFYRDLDVLAEENTIHNIAKKIDSRENLINFLVSEKKVTKLEPATVQIENHTLLNAVLVNNFNIKYSDFLNEEQKETFNKIVSMSNEELISEMKNIKNELTTKLESLLNESTDDEMLKKLGSVKSEVTNSDMTRYSYYKLVELKNGLI
jgi:arsenate reductase-like glutaredoxin family protein